MARAIWSGSISFGLVNVPVKAYPAVRQQDLHFNQFDSKGNRIRYKRVSEKTGREVDFQEIVKGYELSKNHYVMLDSDELENFRPETTKTIEIEDFVSLDDIDPIYFEHTYYLGPDGEGAAKAYSLLLEAMDKQGKVAIGKVVMRTKQYLAAIRPLNGVLAMSTLLFADEVVPRKEIDGLSKRGGSPSDREVKMAGQIIDSLTADWKPERYHDTYREQVLDYIEKKAKGEEVVVEDQPREEAKVVDLMAALEASLEASKKNGGRKRPAKRAAKSTAKRTAKATKKSA